MRRKSSKVKMEGRYSTSIPGRFQSHFSIIGALLLMIMVGMALGKGNSDSLEIVKLKSQLDSTQKAYDAQLNQLKYEKAADDKVYAQRIDDLSSHINWIFGGACAIVAGVFGFMAIIGVIQYRVTDKEAKHIEKVVMDKVTEWHQTDRQLFESSLTQARTQLTATQDAAKAAVGTAALEVETRLNIIAAKNAEAVTGRVGVVTQMASAEVLGVLNKGPLAARAFAFAGMQVLDAQFPGYEDDVKAIAQGIIGCFPLEPTGNWKVRDAGKIVRAFADRLFPIEPNLQRRIHAELDHRSA